MKFVNLPLQRQEVTLELLPVVNGMRQPKPFLIPPENFLAIGEHLTLQNQALFRSRGPSAG